MALQRALSLFQQERPSRGSGTANSGTGQNKIFLKGPHRLEA
jgi:hypothetical protein